MRFLTIDQVFSVTCALAQYCDLAIEHYTLAVTAKTSTNRKEGQSMEEEKRVRVLIAKPGLDGHDMGAKAVLMSLRDAGMEVIYSGRHQTAEQVVAVALQEDVDVVGLSILCGNHLMLSERVSQLLQEKGLKEGVLLMVGGFIPLKDVAKLEALGVDKVMSQGTPYEDIADYIKKNLRK